MCIIGCDLFEDIISLLLTSSNMQLRSQGIDLAGVDLSRLDLRGINFRMSNFKEANLEGANLDNARLQQADLKVRNAIYIIKLDITDHLLKGG